jgi:hypothetical protein
MQRGLQAATAMAVEALGLRDVRRLWGTLMSAAAAKPGELQWLAVLACWCAAPCCALVPRRSVRCCWSEEIKKKCMLCEGVRGCMLGLRRALPNRYLTPWVTPRKRPGDVDIMNQHLNINKPVGLCARQAALMLMKRCALGVAG